MLEISSSNQIKLGALLSYFALGVNILTGLFFTPWVINSIGRENYGLFTLALSVITLFVFDFGLSGAVTRFIAKFLAEGRQDKANNCLGLVYRLYLYIDVFFVIILTAVYFFIPQIYRELTPDEIDRFKVVYSVAAVFTVFSFPFIPVNGILNANEKFIQVKICDVLHKLFIVVAMAGCLLLGGGLYSLVVVNAIAGVLAIFFKLWCISRFTDMSINFRYHDKDQSREILGFSVWTTIIAFCTRMIFTLAPTILGIFAGSVPIAIFGIANSLEGYVYSFTNAIGGMFLPRVSKIVSAGNGDVMPLMIKVGRIQLLVAGLVIGGFICVGREFITLWVGDGFADSYICAVFLIVPGLLQLPQEIGMQTIIAKNEVKYQAIVWMIMATINIMLSFVFAWKYGAIGISISICIAYIIRTIGLDIIFRKRLALDIRSFFSETFAKMGAGLVIVIVLSLALKNFIQLNGLIGLVLKTILFIFIYCIYSTVVVNDEEKIMVKKLLNIKKQ
jgi:O-antigen/teichoic acid export membrane protein